ncbi:MAG: hypothetical protein E7190_00095 [Erysipelotrichaceae bacterium]|nr:hypothetical protein [Erysipelotrichaceae bacterium]
MIWQPTPGCSSWKGNTDEQEKKNPEKKNAAYRKTASGICGVCRTLLRHIQGAHSGSAP